MWRQKLLPSGNGVEGSAAGTRIAAGPREGEGFGGGGDATVGGVEGMQQIAPALPTSHPPGDPSREEGDSGGSPKFQVR